jgi:hypothetical protein
MIVGWKFLYNTSSVAIFGVFREFWGQGWGYARLLLS